MRKRKSERGQALAELVIGMIGMCSVMIGVMVIAVLGMAGIRNAVKAREKADLYSIRGIENGSPTDISTWKDGLDKLTFTNDDIRVSGTAPKPDIFLAPLTDNTGDFQQCYAEQDFVFVKCV